MKNKIILLLVVAVLICTTLAGCGNNDVSAENTIGQDTKDVTDVTLEPTTEVTANNDLTDTAKDETNASAINVDEITFSDYSEMSAEEQKEVVDSFDKIDDFFEWYNEIVEEEKKNPETTEPGPIFPDAPDVSVPDKRDVTYLEYHAMSGDEQMAFINTFNSSADFVAWHTAARKAYEDSMIVIDGTTPIDLGELIGTTEGHN